MAAPSHLQNRPSRPTPSRNHSSLPRSTQIPPPRIRHHARPHSSANYPDLHFRRTCRAIHQGRILPSCPRHLRQFGNLASRLQRSPRAKLGRIQCPPRIHPIESSKSAALRLFRGLSLFVSPISIMSRCPSGCIERRRRGRLAARLKPRPSKLLQAVVQI